MNHLKNIIKLLVIDLDIFFYCLPLIVFLLKNKSIPHYLLINFISLRLGDKISVFIALNFSFDCIKQTDYIINNKFHCYLIKF